MEDTKDCWRIQESNSPKEPLSVRMGEETSPPFYSHNSGDGHHQAVLRPLSSISWGNPQTSPILVIIWAEQIVPLNYCSSVSVQSALPRLDWERRGSGRLTRSWNHTCWGQKGTMRTTSTFRSPTLSLWRSCTGGKVYSYWLEYIWIWGQTWGSVSSQSLANSEKPLQVQLPLWLILLSST